jgi:Tfp pilus assembly protein PilZ
MEPPRNEIHVHTVAGKPAIELEVTTNEPKVVTGSLFLPTNKPFLLTDGLFLPTDGPFLLTDELFLLTGK